MSQIHANAAHALKTDTCYCHHGHGYKELTPLPQTCFIVICVWILALPFYLQSSPAFSSYFFLELS